MKVLTFLAAGLALTACDEGAAPGGPDGPPSGKADDANGAGFCESYPGTDGQNFEGRAIEGENGWVARATTCATRGSEDPEFLKAVAVVMRSIAVYGNGTGGAPANCSPSEAVVRAVEVTQGEFMWYGNYPIFGFHTADSTELDAQCLIEGEQNTVVTPTNGCNFGDDVELSGLAWKDRYDRGAMSLDGAECLASTGLDYFNIVRSYYGEDIGMGCAETKPSRNCDGPNPVDEPEPEPEPEPDEDPKPDEPVEPDEPGPTCSVDNDEWLAAEDLGTVGEGFFSQWTFDELSLPDQGAAWFVYEGEDTGINGNANPEVVASINGADIQVCQYVDCNSGQESITCDEGELHFLPEQADEQSAAAIGCCKSAAAMGYYNEARLTLTFDTFSCKGGSTSNESADVYISVTNTRNECHDELTLSVDYG